MINKGLPRPVAETGTTVTLRKRDWRALAARLEDRDDLAAVIARRSHEAKVGKAAAQRDYLSGEDMRRILDDESPVRVWREKRGLTQRALAEQAEISPSYLAEIETGRKPGSADALRRLARVLGVPMENLVSGGSPPGRAAGRCQSLANDRSRRCVRPSDMVGS